MSALCEGCPPDGYPTDKTRCLPCPRRTLPLDGDVVERVARALYRADVIDGNDARKLNGDALNLDNVDLDKWFDTNADMPLSGPPFLRRWRALAEAAITATRSGDR